jgi:hypothetical protein
MDTTIEGRDATTGRFLPGNSGNGGRKVGSRNQYSEAFLTAFAKDFDQHGVEVIERVRTESPNEYLKAAVKLFGACRVKQSELDINVRSSLLDGGG